MTDEDDATAGTSIEPLMNLAAAVKAADGICPGCRKRYAVGDVVSSLNGAPPRHTDCADTTLAAGLGGTP